MKRSLSQRGAQLLEVLICLVIIAFGVLGYVLLQVDSTVSQVEAYQRSQALILVTDMAQRISLNSSMAASYAGENIGTSDPGDCSAAATTADKDLCQWSRLLRGELENAASQPVAAMVGARGCIASAGGNRYVISIAWQGMHATAAPASSCGRGAFSDENMRRVASTVIGISTP